MQITKYINKHTIGASLVLCGVPYGMYLNFLLPNGFYGIGWSPVIMVLSILLLTDWDNAIRLRFPSFSKVMGYIILFQLIMLAYGMYSDNMTNQYLSFHLFVISLCFSISSNKSYEKFDKFTTALYVVSFPLVILGVFYMASGLIVGDEAYQMRQYNDDYALEPFTACSGMLTNMFAILCVNSKSLWHRVFLAISFAAGLYVILYTGKRTPLLDLFVAFFIYLFLENRLKGKSFKRIVSYSIIGVIVICILIALIPRVGEQAENVWDNFTSGVLNLLGFTNVSDTSGSAIERVYNRRWAYDYINTRFGSINYIFGGGYLVRWLDNPVLESFLDMGLIGIIFYISIVVIYPIKVIFKRYNNTNIVLGLMLASYAIVSMFNSGNPYQYSKYTPIVILAFFVKSYLKSKMSIKNTK